MKRLTEFLLTAVLLFGLVAFVSCNENKAEDGNETEKVTESETEKAVETETESETKKATETETESETEKATETETESETEKATETETESETEKAVETETESETEKATETETESETEKAVETETESETEKATETETESETEKATETETESETEKATDTEKTTENETEVFVEKFTFKAVEYSTVTLKTNSRIKSWENENNLDNNACSQDGIVVSPYFTLKINGIETPVYASRTAGGAHSFTYITVENIPEDGFELDVELTAHKNRSNPVVLPESAGVTASMNGNVAAAKITECGTFTFTFDKSRSNNGSDKPCTIIVKEKIDFDVPKGYKVVEMEPGEYPENDFILKKPRTVYRFKPGQYIFDCLQVGSNTVMYFEDGVILTPKVLTRRDDGKSSTSTIMYAYGMSNIKIIGHAAVDLSYTYEGKNTMFTFENVRNLEINGLASINSSGWTFTLTNCKDVEIKDLLILAYRTFSDGVLLSDCANVNVSGCFVRTGDDAMEVKSTSGGGIKTNNVVFENNAVWTDKGIGYGAVYESNFDQKNVIWRNNSIGYALANWSRHLGCTTISMQGHKPAIRDYDMHFEDIEIYYTRCPIATVVLESGGNVHDIYWKNINAKYIELNNAVSSKPIEIIISGEDSSKADNYKISNLFFDNVVIEGEQLTEKNYDDLIKFNFVKRFFPDINESILKINTQK